MEMLKTTFIILLLCGCTKLKTFHESVSRKNDKRETTTQHTSATIQLDEARVPAAVRLGLTSPVSVAVRSRHHVRTVMGF